MTLLDILALGHYTVSKLPEYWSSIYLLGWTCWKLVWLMLSVCFGYNMTGETCKHVMLLLLFSRVTSAIKKSFDLHPNNKNNNNNKSKWGLWKLTLLFYEPNWIAYEVLKSFFYILLYHFLRFLCTLQTLNCTYMLETVGGLVFTESLYTFYIYVY